ncbi:hypothetical protein [Mechercharimyces sp. CAU 1602]|uniref:hypothetical protein n=1 Tax=Mechercharimyces sp. CAU 1602 TaxID=2973933 RepID=UPI002163ACDF|nr:hypothetical protein [Mechercharimyces sp. CAU 1602]MCS1350346.1 hypothetical protein [Mechercharimyces sp. CAU 1602]
MSMIDFDFFHKYKDLYSRMTHRFLDEVRNIDEDELAQRRMVKKNFRDMVITLKLICRKLESIRDELTLEQYKHYKKHFGDSALLLIEMADDLKMRLTSDEYCSLFSIEKEEWIKSYGRKKPESIMDAVFVEKLSEEYLFDCMIGVVVGRIFADRKLKKQADTFSRYGLGFPF